MATSPFRALRVRNYRFFFTGQLLSLIGSWTHNIAVGWIVLTQTGSSTALGVIISLQFAPTLVLGVWAGAVVDRANKRRLLMGVNTVAAAAALATALLVATGHQSFAVLAVMTTILGTAAAFEYPCRAAFVAEVVDAENLPSALGLGQVIMSLARVAGSAFGGLLLAAFGAAAGLYVNAVSFVVVVLALVAIRPAEIRHVPPQPRGKGQIREGLRYALRTPEAYVPLAAMAVIGTLTVNTQVTTPLLARVTFDAGPMLFAAFSSIGALGALSGALVIASRRTITTRFIGRVAVMCGMFTLLEALAPTAGLGLVTLVFAAFGASTYISGTSVRLQTIADDAFRGRLISLYAILLLGSTPIGSLIIGLVAQATNPRWAIALGAMAALLTGMTVLWWVRRDTRRRAVVPQAVEVA